MNILAVGGSSLPEFPTFIQLLQKHPFTEDWNHLISLWEEVVYSIAIALIISLVVYFGGRKRELIPHGLQNFLEIIVENFRKLIHSILGEETDKHVAFLGTLFIYILLMNMAGLVPFLKSPSSSLSICIGMAVCVFFRVQYLNIRNMGVGGYLYHMSGSPKDLVSWMIVPLMLPIEIITQISRPITLALRLAGNVMGEHALIGIFALFAVAVFSFEQLPFGIPIQIPAMLYGLLTSLMQALVFTLLSAVYIYLSMPHPPEHHSTQE